MTKPFVLGDDGRMTVVGPQGLQRFLDAVEPTDNRGDERTDSPER
jgi:hypothetical protein